MSVTYTKINPREILKRKLLESRRVVGLDGKVHMCEGQAFREHTCKGGLHMNEVFITRKKVQGVKPASARMHIITDERNCAIVCQAFHWDLGHSTAFRLWFKGIQEDRYSSSSIDEYLSGAWSKLE